ncbi:14356_t:CDS:2 [Acaulospora morrowiae]|uniref:14356_t:CDS:1 n=1 Tax=Acaulospora morrowiae TaxID=94023 RepID=A0A9N9C5K0_9GLOM|nr:14356_t:CDS:2 [Acaulospora morrowiae]
MTEIAREEMDLPSKIRSLFDNPKLSDVVLHVDGRAYHGHTCILIATSGFFKSFFLSHYKHYRHTSPSSNHTDLVIDASSSLLSHNATNTGSDEPSLSTHHNKFSRAKDEYHFHDFSCSMTNTINNWYDLKKKKYQGNELKLELYYSSQQFGNFLAYLYGHPLPYKKMDNLFVFAYLAHKFCVPELTEHCENLLVQVWDRRMWRITLKASKWLELHKLRTDILKFLWEKGVEKLFNSRIAKFLKEDDVKDIIKLAEGEKKIQAMMHKEDEGNNRECVQHYQKDGQMRLLNGRISRDSERVGGNDKKVQSSIHITPGGNCNGNASRKSKYQSHPVTIYDEYPTKLDRERNKKNLGIPLSNPKLYHGDVQNESLENKAAVSPAEDPYKRLNRIKRNNNEISYKRLKVKYDTPSEDEGDDIEVDRDVPRENTICKGRKQSGKVLATTKGSKYDLNEDGYAISTVPSGYRILQKPPSRGRGGKGDETHITYGQLGFDSNGVAYKKQKCKYVEDIKTSEDDSEDYYYDDNILSSLSKKQIFTSRDGVGDYQTNELNQNNHDMIYIKSRRSFIATSDCDSDHDLASRKPIHLKGKKKEKFFINPESTSQKCGKNSNDNPSSKACRKIIGVPVSAKKIQSKKKRDPVLVNGITSAKPKSVKLISQGKSIDNQMFNVSEEMKDRNEQIRKNTMTPKLKSSVTTFHKPVRFKRKSLDECNDLQSKKRVQWTK